MKPTYYDKFTCIADKCEFTCCQEWKIGVDEDTLNNWSNIPAEELLRDKNDFKGDNLSDYVVSKEDNPVMGLCSNKLCPFLNDNKLCNIVLKHGEDFISETCHTFPRESHEYKNHVEKTLMLCCPHVIDLLNSEQEFSVINDVAEGELFDLRKSIIAFIQDNKSISIEHKLLIIFYILLECYEKDVSDNSKIYEEELWLLVPELEKTFKAQETNLSETLNENNELMLDLIDNYLKEGVYKKYLSIFNDEALKIEDAFENGAEEPVLKAYNEFLKEFNKFEDLLIKVLAQEFFGELIISDEEWETNEADNIEKSDINECNIEGMLVKYQWIVMEYALIKHFCFLSYKMDGELSYSKLKVNMVLAFRIMGFDDDDIYEYMENSFEELVWDFGYLTLLIN